MGSLCEERRARTAVAMAVATLLAAAPVPAFAAAYDYEGHGTIQFIGTFSTFSWTVPSPETWHGSTFGIRTTQALEPDISISGVTASEGNGGATAFTFDVALSGPGASTVNVDDITADGTATAGSDYTAAAGTLSFSPGVTVQPVTVYVTGDTTVEPNETFTVNLYNPYNATISVAQATGTILDDDASPPPITTPAPIPTLSDWATLLMAATLGGLAAIRMRRRR
jgi:hypothetical protein